MTKAPRLAGFDPPVQARLLEFLKKSETVKKRKVAVFDADGTLWNGDIGEVFFKHQIKEKTLANPPKGVAYDKLWDMYVDESSEGSPEKAYGWLAQWNKGMKEAELLRLCREFIDKFWLKKFFKPMQDLTATLDKAGFEVWVVSGSPRWIVLEGARHFGVAPERVIGSAVEIKGGILTDKIEHGVIPYRAGKSALVKKLIGEKPLFGAGNTYWDKELIETATDLHLTVSSEHSNEPNYDSEQKLKALAIENGWLIQRF